MEKPIFVAQSKNVMSSETYKPKNPIRIVTAASLFDGHDAAINIMRRIIQSSGAEVIHLGHNRSAGEIVRTAIQEDAQAIAITSYQGGHIDYFGIALRRHSARRGSGIASIRDNPHFFAR